MSTTESTNTADTMDTFISDIVIAKTSSLIILGLASCIAGFLPIKLNDLFHKKTNKPSTFDKVMSFFLNFGGGVLICTVFLHLLPEIRSNVENLEKQNILKEYAVLSYPEFIMCVGFFMMFFVEETVHSFLERTDHKNLSAFELDTGVNENVYTVTKTDSLKKNDCVVPVHINTIHCSEHKCFTSECSRNYHSCENGLCHMEGNGHAPQVAVHGSHSHIPDLRKPSLNSFLTVLALSVHEIFEGLAVGLEKETTMVWYLLAAVSCHKVVLAAFIGVQLISAEVKKVLAYGYVIGFALTSPIGIFIGMVMSSSSQASDTMNIVSVVLQAMATGTLLYIVFFEVFRKQFGEYQISGLMRLVASVTGFIFMLGIQVLLKDDD